MTEIMGNEHCFGPSYAYSIYALVVLIFAYIGEGHPCAQRTRGSTSVLLGGLVIPDPGGRSAGSR